MDSGKKPFACYLIGDGSLIIQCGEILLSKNNEVCGIISSDEAVARWCDEKSIPYLNLAEELLSQLKNKEFDFLFSINNPLLLNREILNLPKKCTINYHDSLLPQYAGVNATSWAIMNRETVHGITWHIADESLDTGDILKQVVITVNENDTVELLNMKCYEAAIDSFSDLIDELSAGKQAAITQNSAKRTYYPKYMRPYAAALINFNQEAAAVQALMRALSFGKITNPLGTPKIIVGNQFYIVEKLEIVATARLSAKNAEPGTILSFGEAGLQIATRDMSVVISRLLSLNGNRVDIAELINDQGLQIGTRLYVSPDECEQIHQKYCESAKNELFWVNKLKKIKPVAIPYELRTAPEAASEINAIIGKPAAFCVKGEPVDDKAAFLITALAIYLARITLEESFDLGYETGDSSTLHSLAQSLFEPVVPFTVELDYSQSFWAAYKHIAVELRSINNKMACCRDIAIRYPVLSKHDGLGTCNDYPIHIGIRPKSDWGRKSTEGDLSFYVTESGEEYAWVFDRKIIDFERVSRMDANFQVLLNGILIKPQEKISKLPLLTEADKRQLAAWRGQNSNYPQNTCIHNLFESQAATVAAVTAVIFEDQRISYGELNSKANRLGHYLKKQGVRPNTLVGIYIDRSLEMIIAILAIVKAGGAYVPIDPDVPEERARFIIEDTAMSLCLTSQKYREKLGAFNIDRIALDSQADLFAEESPENVDSAVTSTHLAYVMYTSGSTGKPKGVMIIHEAVLALLDGCEVLVPSEGNKVGTNISTYSFDTSVWEIFSMLCYGRELHIIRPDLYVNASGFAKYLIEHKITTTYINPSLITDTFYELKKLGEQSHLTYFKTGLEAKKQKIMQAARDYSATMLVANLYGPTETTVCGTYYEFHQAQDPEADTPIGKPMPNYEAYIVDRNLAQLPPGVPGELLIGGVCVAPGYWNRPELTREKFIQNPIIADSPYKVYRTGDMVRFLADGNIQFIGRIDNQFKVHGYRIEPAEIEATLSLHPDVMRAIVTTVQYNSNDKRITAYIVPKRQKDNLAKDIKEYLAAKLPFYMIPSYFVVIDKIPLHINGKINYKALPLPDSKQDFARRIVAPRNSGESILAEIWRDLFHLEEISVQDNFFDLGGYSLLAVRLFNEIEKRTQIRIPISHIFELPTIEKQAMHIWEHSKNNDDSLVVIRSSGHRPPLFCVHALDGEIVRYGYLSFHLDENQPVFGLRLNKQEVISGSGGIEFLAEKYVAEIRKIQPAGPYYLLGYSLGGVIVFEMAQQLNSAGQTVGFLGLLDTIHPQIPLDQKSLRYRKVKRSLQTLKSSLVKIIPTDLIESINRVYASLPLIYKPTPAEIEEKKVNDTLHAWRSAYIPSEYPGKITLFKAQECQVRQDVLPDNQLGWQQVALGGIETYEMAGDHTSLVQEENIGTLGAILMECLRQSQANGQSERTS